MDKKSNKYHLQRKLLYSVKNINLFYDNFNNSDKYPYIVIPDELLKIKYSKEFEINDYLINYIKKPYPPNKQNNSTFYKSRLKNTSINSYSLFKLTLSVNQLLIMLLLSISIILIIFKYVYHFTSTINVADNIFLLVFMNCLIYGGLLGIIFRLIRIISYYIIKIYNYTIGNYYAKVNDLKADELNEIQYKKAYEKYTKSIDEYNGNVKAVNSINSATLKKINIIQEKFEKEKKVKDININVNYLAEFIKNNIYPTKVNRPIKKGPVETLFVNFLKIKLKDLVTFIVDHELKTDNSDYENNYIPDIIIKTKSGLLIDIEIDEPYALDTKQPIHYTDADFQRDKFFKNNNYCVVRFAEEQVLNHPYQCTYFILELIECLDSKYWQDREPVDICFNMPQCNKWSMNEARRLQIENYREEYLKDIKWLKHYAVLDVEEYSSGRTYSIIEFYDSDYKFLFYNEFSTEREVNRAKVNKVDNPPLGSLTIEGPTDDLPW